MLILTLAVITTFLTMQAPDAEILMIPGAGNRMVRKFKEYRVYPNLAKFRREIGKYVNEKEVARLERYVTIQ